MNSIKVIITGATGMVGEGVLFECLQNEKVSSVLMINRRHYELNHPKLKELIVPNLLELNPIIDELKDYDACFFCAGISSIGMKENEYTKITYDITLQVAKTLVALNPNMTFNYVSGQMTDITEKGKLMWARVKGKTENDLIKLPFKNVFNFRPGFMKSTKGQKNVKFIFKFFAVFYPKLFPSSSLTLAEVGKAMINGTLNSYNKNVLEVVDIKHLAKG